MEFTKESVYNNWTLLQGNSTPEIKKNADRYLTAFKKSPKLISICTELFTSQCQQPQSNGNGNDDGIKFYSTLMIYQHIQQTISTIIESKESFNQYKTFLLSTIFPLIPNCKEVIISNVCKAIAILVLTGKVTYWISSFDDLIQMSSVCNDYLLYATIILENCHNELTAMKVNAKMRMFIKDQCIDFSPKIRAYICCLLNTNSNTGNTVLMKHIFDLTHGWIKFKVNILTIPKFTVILLSGLVQDNRRIIHEVLSESFQYASTSIQALMGKYPKENIKDILDTKISNEDKEELGTIREIIGMISNLVLNYSNKKLNDNEEELLFYTASIFSSLCSNYIYLFFTDSTSNNGINGNKNTSELLMNLFLFFIANPKRKISYLFFDSISKINTHINSHSLISLLSPTSTQHQSFLQFLFKLNDSILYHSKLKDLNVNYTSPNKEERIKLASTSKSSTDLDLLSLLEEEEDNEVEVNDISVMTYRKVTSEAFSDIFILIMNNYSNGAQLFLERTGAKLISMDNNTTNESILLNKEYLILVEAVLFSIRSIRHCFNTTPSMLLSFSNFILKSQMIHNDKILISFIIFIDSIAMYIHKDKELYVNTIQFLLSVMNKSYALLVKVAGVVILAIVETSDEYNQVVFNALLEFYIKRYSQYEGNTMCHLCEGIMKCFRLSPKEVISKELMSLGFTLISPFEAILQSYSINDYRALIKAFEVYSIIIHYMGMINKDMLYTVFNKNASALFNCCIKLTSIPNKDINSVDSNSEHNELYISIILMLINTCNYLKEQCLNYFDQINNIIYSIYSNNNTMYDVIYLMKSLYNEALKHTQSPYCRIVIEKFCLICSQICTNAYTIEKNNLETIKLFASFVSLMLDNIKEFHNDCFNWDLMGKVMQLFSESNETIVDHDMSANVIRALRKVMICKGIPIEFKTNYLKQIVLSVIGKLDHYGDNAIKEIGLLLIEVRRISSVAFEEGIKERIEMQRAQIVIEYFNMFCNKNDDRIDKLIGDLIKIKKGELDVSCLNKFAIEIKAMQITSLNAMK